MGAAPLPITSLVNNHIKDLVRLRQRRHRDKKGVMIVEESLVIARGLDAGIPYREIYFCPDHLDVEDHDLLAKLRAVPGIRAFELTPPVMAKVAYRDEPQGLLAIAAQTPNRLEDLELPTSGPALLVVLEAVKKPGNLGAVQRVADGAGAHAVIACGGGVDPWNPNVLRASRGACFTVPVVRAETTMVLDWLRTHGVTTLATSPKAPATFSQVDLTGPVAILLGTEHEGLSAETLAAADQTVAIPMRGRGDSLNVSTSAAVLLYEAERQRSVARKAP